MSMFKLRFAERDLQHWGSRYAVKPEEIAIESQTAPAARTRGWLTRPDFLDICRWKSPRSKPRCEQNTEAAIRETTTVALGSHGERLKIGSLLTLEGVSWPTASVVLHLCDRNRYPILDVRALWSVGLSHTQTYTYDLWEAYTKFVRGLSDRTGLTMRAVDRALWEYSRHRQRHART